MNAILSNFCSSPYWDSNLTWNSPNPDFTACFEKTVLVWLPCLFLWLLFPWEIYYLRRTITRTIPLNRFNISKLVIISVLIAINLFDVIFNVFVDGNRPSVDIITPIIKLVTFTLFFCLTYAYVKCGVRSSGTHSLFSFILVLCGVPQLRTVLKLFYNSDTIFNQQLVNSVLYIIHFSSALVIFAMNTFFVDDAPIEDYQTTEQNICPEFVSASFFSRLFFNWFNRLAWKGYKKTLNVEDLWNLDNELQASQIGHRFESQWYSTSIRLRKKLSHRTFYSVAYRKKVINDEDTPLLIKDTGSICTKQTSILQPLFHTFGIYFFFGCILKIFEGILNVANSQILNSILAFVQEEDRFLWHGHFYTFLLFANALSLGLIFNYQLHMMERMGLQMRTALVSIIYKKVLKISNGAKREFTNGEIMNLMAVDTQKFVQVGTLLPYTISSVFEMIVSFYFLWNTLGPCVLTGITVLIVCLIVNGVFVSKLQKKQLKQMEYSDKRVKLCNEAFAGIRVLKMYACEPTFEKRVTQIRDKEIKLLRISAYLQGTISFIWIWAPFLVSFITFGSYIFFSERHMLDARVAFVSLSLLNIIRNAALHFSSAMSVFVEGNVAIKRIDKFLNAEELDPKAVLHQPCIEPIMIKNGEFSWDLHDGSSVLRNINLVVRPGDLVAVVGPVGSGKSSLISAILGEMYVKSGFVNTTGSLAYVPQQAWIRNATLKKNITFGIGEMEKSLFYNEILEACALIPDLEILSHGDQTEIGEKGINLSGGQKQRISLARSIYSEADVYLLDDPLSAVDAHVGKHIFEEVIGPKGLLKEKTRIFVTHSLAFLSQVDNIIILENGMISGSGSYNELTKNGRDAFTCLSTDRKECKKSQKFHDVKTHRKRGFEQSSEKFIESTEHDQTKHNIAQQAGDLTVEEGMELGGIKWSVIKFYLKAFGLGSTALTLSTNVISQLFSMLSDYWLSAWSSEPVFVKSTDSSGISTKQFFYLGVYALLGVGQAISVITKIAISFTGTLRASKQIHEQLLNSVFHWPATTFDRVPLGRIINRLGSDVNILDNTLPSRLQDSLLYASSLLASFFVISYNSPLFVTIFLPIGIIYYLLQSIYAATAKQLKRLESVSKSPIYSHFGDTISGAHSIRAYGLQALFIKTTEDKIDYNLKILYLFHVANSWVGMRLELIAAFILLFSTILALNAKDTMSASLVGLSVTYAFQVIINSYWLIMKASEVENNIVSIERIKEYLEIEQEAPWEVPNMDKFLSKEWPDEGEITFENFRTRYRKSLEVVLNGISFRVNGGERVGIVGRTGAGKSSLSLSLFRLIESCGGNIFIDGVDISKIGLHTLRSRLTIIPQDPILFTGTLRMNLDLAGNYSDEDIWSALQLTNMETYVHTLNGGLLYEIEEGGSNLSVGQRQLICLARALLCKTKVLILDEATASVDVETDNFIQATIRKEFKNCTVLTIAHRLKTVLDYDRIMVLDRGHIAEFESPKTLLASRQSIFARMVMESGSA